MQQPSVRELAHHPMLERWFPAPRFLVARSIGVDISDASVKWMGLEQATEGGYVVRTFGSRPIPAGVVVGGVIHDTKALAGVLRDIRIESRSSVAHAALPEEQAYVFNMYIPDGTKRDQVLRLVEFEFEGRVPIPPATATYDFDIIQEGTPQGTQIGVTVFPREITDHYVESFEMAGFELASLEIEARSIGRAIDDGSRDESVTLLVDFGLSRTGFAILKCGVPIFTTTVEFGNEAATQRIKQKFSLSDEDIKTIRNDEGLLATGEHAAIREEFEKSAIGLADEIAKYYHFWDTRRDEHGERVTPVDTVTLVGGSANMKGLVDLIAGKVQAQTQRADIWQHILRTESTLPPIDKRTSLQFATAAGLSLRGV